jgi:hypothetical protein
MTKTHVLVALDYLKELEDDLMFLDALRAAGVDNWDGYDYAQDIYREISQETLQ